MISSLLSRITGILPPEGDDFDPGFYRAHYPDLADLRSVRALRRHYERHGRTEGRARNATEVVVAAVCEHGAPPPEFSAAEYRALNPDLGMVFEHDWQYLLHFIKHGRAEGRPWRRLPSPGPEGGGPPPWEALLRPAEFLVTAASWCSETSNTRADAAALFWREGVERLAPLSFAMHFDPAFHRALYGGDDHGDAKRYRRWLTMGIPAGEAPNEAAWLFEHLGHRPFPTGFDWRAYAASAGLTLPPDPAARAVALDHAFRHGSVAALVRAATRTDARFWLSAGRSRLRRHAYADAADIFARAEAFGGGAEAAHLLGDAERGRGRLAAARDAYSRAVTAGGHSEWTVIHLAEMEQALGRSSAAFDVLENGRSRWELAAPFRMAARRLIQSDFDRSSETAKALYRAGRRTQGDEVVTRSVEDAAQRIRRMGRLGPQLPPEPRGHVAFLANTDLVQCDFYRVRQKIAYLEAAGIETRLTPLSQVETFEQSLIGARAALFYRTPAFPEVIRAILTADAMGLDTIYDLDDLIFDSDLYPEPIDTYGGAVDSEEYVALQYGVPLFRGAIGLCRRAIASTAPLAARLAPLTQAGRCDVLPNGIDSRLGALSKTLSEKPHDGRFTIFYGSGTRAHAADFTHLVEDALVATLEAFPQAQFIACGHVPIGRVLERFGPRVVRIPFTANATEYWTLLSTADVSLAPLVPGPIADCKSEIKWLEAAAFGVPSIVSPTAAYRAALEDGTDVLFAADPEDWRSALLRLADDPALRFAIGAAARVKAERDFGPMAGAERCRTLLASPQASVPAAVARRCLLVANVFYAPQSFGGATRVVEDNVAHFRAEAPDLDVVVLATDEGVGPPGRLRVEEVGSLPVVRLTTPLEPDMDWRPFNGEHSAAFDAVLDRFAPDLTHLHCIQRLTATLAERVARRDIPYVITMHDAWWFSDDQFLTDNDGFLHENAGLFNALPGRDVAASAARRRQLAAIALGARHVIAPSESFAALCRSAGFAGAIAVPNGVPVVARLQRSPSASGRLRLGHIGGRAPHKGAALVEGVLRTGRFDRLELVMIDSRLGQGDQINEVWGETPVLRRGPYPQHRIAELYAKLDVLLAPSTWPESFGLVAREAAAAGLWVVASDRGAMGEEVQHGVDGFLVDTRSPAGLKGVLAMFNAEPERYMSPPPQNARRLRTAADQGDDLLRLYRKLIT